MMLLLMLWIIVFSETRPTCFKLFQKFVFDSRASNDLISLSQLNIYTYTDISVTKIALGIIVVTISDFFITLHKILLLTRPINKNQSWFRVLGYLTFLPPEMLWISWRALVSRSFMAKLDSFFAHLFTNNVYLILLRTIHIWSLYEQYGWKCIWYSCFCATCEFVIGCFKVGCSVFSCSRFIIIFILISFIHDELLLDVVYYE